MSRAQKSYLWIVGRNTCTRQHDSTLHGSRYQTERTERSSLPRMAKQTTPSSYRGNDTEILSTIIITAYLHPYLLIHCCVVYLHSACAFIELLLQLIFPRKSLYYYYYYTVCTFFLYPLSMLVRIYGFTIEMWPASCSLHRRFWWMHPIDDGMVMRQRWAIEARYMGWLLVGVSKRNRSLWDPTSFTRVNNFNGIFPAVIAHTLLFHRAYIPFMFLSFFVSFKWTWPSL